ncbi:cyclic-di-AMP receptor [Lactobacillus crispatus]|uniref:cyclic-di-AMP receptor n=1 Tax=Lactobacillus crispatus TaxID=47770 RepID=UPI0023AA10EB|nr:cyclic-di-AMP receptor [Lactobacillus crispatus]WEB33118.1 cyclic-di-AMP receptor [Lactobacillus crispatus]
MKLVIAIVQKEDSNDLQRAFVQNDFRATKLATSGGFLSQGNTTFLVGCDDDKVDDVLKIIKEQSRAREEIATPHMVSTGYEITQPLKVTVGVATYFVVPVDEFKRF